MNREELLEGIEKFRQQLISRRDAEMMQFDENCDEFIHQIEMFGLFEVIEELRMRQGEVRKSYMDFYKTYLDALDKKEQEINEGKLDKYLKE